MPAVDRVELDVRHVLRWPRADAIDANWAVVQASLDAWGRGEGEVESYAAGRKGPADADGLLERDGRHWLPLGK